MFKLSAKPNSVTWPVTVNVPQDGGKIRAHTFEVRFTLLPQDEIDHAVGASRNGDETDDLLNRALIGWTGVKEEDGETDVPFNDETKRQMLAIPYVRAGLLKAFFEATSGKAAARKN